MSAVLPWHFAGQSVECTCKDNTAKPYVAVSVQGSAPQWQPLVYHDTGNPPPFQGGPQPSFRPNNNFRAPLAGQSSSNFASTTLMQSMPMQQRAAEVAGAAAGSGTGSASSGGSGSGVAGMLGNTQYNRDVMSAGTSSSAWSSDTSRGGSMSLGSSQDQGATTAAAAGGNAGLPVDANQMYLTTDGSTWSLQISPTGSMTAGTPQEQAAAAAAAAAAPASLGVASGMLLPMSAPTPASAAGSAGVSVQNVGAGQGMYPDAGTLQGAVNGAGRMSQALLMQLLQPQGASAAQQADITAAAAAAAAAALQMQPLQLLQMPGGFAGMPQQQGNAALQLQPGFAAPTVYMPQVAVQPGMTLPGVMPASMGWGTAQQLQLQQAMLQQGSSMGMGAAAGTMGGAEGTGFAGGAAAASQVQLLQQQFWGQQQLHSMAQRAAQNWPMAGDGTGTGVVGAGYGVLQQQGGAEGSGQGQYAADSMQQGLLNGVWGTC